MLRRKLGYLLVVLLGILALTACTQLPLPFDWGTTSETPAAAEASGTASEDLAAEQEVTTTPLPPSGITPTAPPPAKGPQRPMQKKGTGPYEHGPERPREKEMPGRGHGPGKHGGKPPAGGRQDNPWRWFHQQAIPEAFVGKGNPVPPEADSLARGQAIYEAQCASCHGETGMGDGPAAASLNPPPAPVAHTSCRLSDAYLFWRIHEGGTQWGTAMPAFGEILSEEDIWHVINYLRSLEPCP